MFVLDNGGRNLGGTEVETTADENPECGEQPLGDRSSVDGLVWFDGGHGLLSPVMFGDIGPLAILLRKKLGKIWTNSNFDAESLCFHKLLEIS